MLYWCLNWYEQNLIVLKFINLQPYKHRKQKVSKNTSAICRNWHNQILLRHSFLTYLYCER